MAILRQVREFALLLLHLLAVTIYVAWGSSKSRRGRSANDWRRRTGGISSPQHAADGSGPRHRRHYCDRPPSNDPRRWRALGRTASISSSSSSRRTGWRRHRCGAAVHGNQRRRTRLGLTATGRRPLRRQRSGQQGTSNALGSILRYKGEVIRSQVLKIPLNNQSSPNATGLGRFVLTIPPNSSRLLVGGVLRLFLLYLDLRLLTRR